MDLSQKASLFHDLLFIFAVLSLISLYIAVTNLFSEGFTALFIVTFFGSVTLTSLSFWFLLKARKVEKELD